MPYINAHRRRELDSEIYAVRPETPGELNYAITALCHRYVFRGRKDYATFNEVIGVLEAAKLEFYRVVVAPYEERKRRETGPVSDLDSAPEGGGL